MKFQAAYSYLKRGHDIKLPEWGGFWRWDKAKQTIMIHTRRGEVLDIRETNDVDYTIGFTLRTDWELVGTSEEFSQYEKAFDEGYKKVTGR